MVGLKGTHFSIELLLTSSGFDEVSPFFCFLNMRLKSCYLPSLFLSTISNIEKKRLFVLFCLAFSVESHLQSLRKKVNYKS